MAPAARCRRPLRRNSALGLPLAQAVQAARAYILGAIAAGALVRTGQGARAAEPWVMRRWRSGW